MQCFQDDFYRGKVTSMHLTVENEIKKGLEKSGQRRRYIGGERSGEGVGSEKIWGDTSPPPLEHMSKICIKLPHPHPTLTYPKILKGLNISKKQFYIRNQQPKNTTRWS